MNTKVITLWLLTILSQTSYADQNHKLYGRQIALPNSGLMKTLDMVERDAVENDYAWRDIVKIIRNGLTNNLDSSDIASLQRVVHEPPENTPILIRTLASMAWFSQTGDLNEVMIRLRSGNESLIESALGTAAIIPHNVEFRDELFGMIKSSASHSSSTGLVSYFYFALRHYNNPDDVSILYAMLNGIQINSVMRQAIFQSLLYDDPAYNHSLSWKWIRELFMNETDIATIKIMLEELRESRHAHTANSIVDEKRSFLTKLLEVINTKIPTETTNSAIGGE